MASDSLAESPGMEYQMDQAQTAGAGAYDGGYHQVMSTSSSSMNNQYQQQQMVGASQQPPPYTAQIGNHLHP